jgi:hypothetical protein
MFIRICLLSALAMGALAGPAVSDDGAAAKASGASDRQPIVPAQLQRSITPKKPHVHRAAPACPFGRC